MFRLAWLFLAAGAWGGFSCVEQITSSGSPCFTASTNELRLCTEGTHCDFGGAPPNTLSDSKTAATDKTCVADVPLKMHIGAICSNNNALCLSGLCGSNNRCEQGSTATGQACSHH